MFEDKELFIKTAKDIMVPALSVIGYIILTVLLACIWLPMLFIMGAFAIVFAITIADYKDRLAEKKRQAERGKRGW